MTSLHLPCRSEFVLHNMTNSCLRSAMPWWLELHTNSNIMGSEYEIIDIFRNNTALGKVGIFNWFFFYTWSYLLLHVLSWPSRMTLFSLIVIYPQTNLFMYSFFVLIKLLKCGTVVCFLIRHTRNYTLTRAVH